ncbi:GHKL domain-containing protein [Anaerocolumna sedimenticola]|uniref:histidine kinase n=1 Tax=Anaerocolumna sedimenticola TaxID=2696063 RepID=A0A6P1TQS7_9FIRM|nr:HAMP domain-containing sensor histidine kinase [Anaerocolumna sedimenticola]QHQ63294.1 GHKL domain-containing protein [Anaerocolumna sedimenticola]
MKIKLKSIRVKLIGTFFACALITVSVMFFIFMLLMKASENIPFAVFFLNHIIFFTVLLFLFLVFLLICCFYLFTNRRMRYFEDIHNTLEDIAGGDLDFKIPVRGTDELSELAMTVNHMTYQLKLLQEEEKRWEKTKNDMVTNVSHDLRTPLTSILGYMELISKGNYTDEKALKHYADVAYNKGINLKTLVDDLFEYSKLNSTELKLNRININLTELLEQIVLGFLPVFKDNNMEYDISYAHDKIMVDGDPLLLARMFDNLINNAVNYGKEGKYLRVEIRKETHNAIIRIINNGHTIPAEDLPYLFERFYKADKSRSIDKNGSGIGLAIVKSIVDMHHGTVKAESEDDRTTFEVRLPFKCESETN